MITRCPYCRAFAYIETQDCTECGRTIGMHYPTRTFAPAPDEGYVIDGERWVRCANWSLRCNWLVRVDDPAANCFACRLTRRRPAADDALGLEKLAEAAQAKRRLLVRLFELDLPVVPYYEQAGGLAFDLVSSQTTGEKVTIGHAGGVITIDLAESLDAYRESLRVKLGEPYRTLLGHFRHEIGHYYQPILAGAEPLLGECRALFGDERANYADAIERHYAHGAPEGWGTEFISEYATMHPWEDFAETFAHYLHITSSLATAAAAGVVLCANRFDGLIDDDIVPVSDYRDLSSTRMLTDWHWLSLMFNRANRTMGQRDLYPFTIPGPVETKLGFIHKIVTRRVELAEAAQATQAPEVAAS
ncbi:MAG: zinc-binding metallopeptidase family protein [Cellulomonadaceae bacterium]